MRQVSRVAIVVLMVTSTHSYLSARFHPSFTDHPSVCTHTHTHTITHTHIYSHTHTYTHTLSLSHAHTHTHTHTHTHIPPPHHSHTCTHVGPCRLTHTTSPLSIIFTVTCVSMTPDDSSHKNPYYWTHITLRCLCVCV